MIQSFLYRNNFPGIIFKNEKDELVANCDRLATLKHSSVNPLAFTEQGVSMLSTKEPMDPKILQGTS